MKAAPLHQPSPPLPTLGSWLPPVPSRAPKVAGGRWLSLAECTNEPMATPELLQGQGEVGIASSKPDRETTHKGAEDQHKGAKKGGAGALFVLP